jgi:hypothetical protein
LNVVSNPKHCDKLGDTMYHVGQTERPMEEFIDERLDEPPKVRCSVALMSLDEPGIVCST